MVFQGRLLRRNPFPSGISCTVAVYLLVLPRAANQKSRCYFKLIGNGIYAVSLVITHS